MDLSCCRGGGLSPAAASPQRLLKQPRCILRLLIGPSPHRIEEEETSRESSSWEHTYMISASKWGRLLALIFVGRAMGVQAIFRMSYKSRPLAALAHFELGRVCGRGEDELLFRSEESLRLAEREESLQWEKRRLRYGAPTYYVREEGEGC